MKKLFLLFLFLYPLISFCQSEDCKYRINTKDSFDGTIIKELENHNLCYISPNKPNEVICDPTYNSSYKEYTLNITLKRKGLSRYMVVDYMTNLELGGWILKVKLENGKILIFKNFDQWYESTMPHVVAKLLPNEIQELKKSPIELIRFDKKNKLVNDLSSPEDFKISGKSKYYLIDHLDCLN